MTYKFKIEKGYLSIDNFDGVSGNKNIYECEFEISCEENGAVWFAVFKKDSETYVTPITDGKCAFPYECLKEPCLVYIGCYAECAGDKRISTNWQPLNVGNGAYSQGTAPEAPSNDLWETLLANSVPVIGENGNWFTYDMQEKEYVDTGFTAMAGAYEIPEGGIPKTELSSDVQSSLDLADSAIQVHQDISGLASKELIARRTEMYGKYIEPTDDEYFIFEEIQGVTPKKFKISADITKTMPANIVIPYEHIEDGQTYPVTCIAENGFKNLSNIASIVIPSSVDTIEDSAFSGTNCTIYIPSSVTWMGIATINRVNHFIYCDKGSEAEAYCVLDAIPYSTVVAYSSDLPVKSISAAGTALTPDANGNVNIPKATEGGYGGTLGVMSVATSGGLALRGLNYNASLWCQSTTDASIETRSKAGGVVPRILTNDKIDYIVKRAMTDGVGAAWTDSERLAALLRMGCTVDNDGYVKWTATPTPTE